MTTSETPSARAASTYIVSRITSTEPRTMRATRGAYTIPMATMTLATLGPSEAISAMARMMAGKAMSPSITRITGLSSRRQYPAASPKTSPTAKASSTTAAPTRSDSRAPYTTRLHTSRPTSSVPTRTKKDLLAQNILIGPDDLGIQKDYEKWLTASGATMLGRCESHSVRITPGTNRTRSDSHRKPGGESH